MEKNFNLIELIEIITRILGDYENKQIEVFESSGLSIKQISYLEAIGKLNNPTMTDLAGSLKLSKPSVTAIINKLSSSGYITKVNSSGDKRVFNISLTDKGMKIIAAHNSIHKNIAGIFTKTLDENEVEELVALLNKTVKGIIN